MYIFPGMSLEQIETTIDRLERLVIPSLKEKRNERYSDQKWQAEVSHYTRIATDDLAQLWKMWETAMRPQVGAVSI